jgi:hypothetical protein
MNNYCHKTGEGTQPYQIQTFIGFSQFFCNKVPVLYVKT